MNENMYIKERRRCRHNVQSARIKIMNTNAKIRGWSTEEEERGGEGGRNRKGIK